MTEHAAGVFVFFFLAEYASILLICILTSVLFLGGYLHNFAFLTFFISLINQLGFLIDIYYYLEYLIYIYKTCESGYFYSDHFYLYYTKMKTFTPISVYSITEYFSNPIFIGFINGITLGFKSCLMVFIFIWARASLPRIRYDQLMSFCWTILLPLVIAFIILYPCILSSFDIISINITLF